MTVRLRDDVSTATSELGMVLLDERTGRYWQLNRSGAAVLQALLDGGSLDDAVAAVTGTYAVTAATAKPDARALLDSLTSNGLVEP